MISGGDLNWAHMTAERHQPLGWVWSPLFFQSGDLAKLKSRPWFYGCDRSGIFRTDPSRRLVPLGIMGSKERSLKPLEYKSNMVPMSLRGAPSGPPLCREASASSQGRWWKNRPKCSRASRAYHTLWKTFFVEIRHVQSSYCNPRKFTHSQRYFDHYSGRSPWQITSGNVSRYEENND